MKIVETQRPRIEERFAMKTKSIVQFVVLLSASARLAGAADNPNEALQKGLLEEEANHNLDAAIQAYQTVINQFDDQRKIAATAVFRLGECYRKQGKTNEAVAQYQRVGRDFTDQDALVKLSAQNLSALGTTSASSFQQYLQQIQGQSGLDEEAKEIQRYRDLAQNSPDLLNAVSGGGTPLESAAGKGQLEVAKFLLDHGADVNSRNDQGYTPLHFATVNGSKAMVELFLDHQAEANGENNEGVRPLHLAASRGFLSVVEALLVHGADPNAQMIGGTIEPLGKGGGYDRATPLHYAAAGGYLAIVKLLLDHKADVNVKARNGRTPLHAAADFNRLEIVKLLLAHQANPNASASDGTPLGLAVRNRNAEMVKALIAAGADVNAKGVPVDSNPQALNAGNILVPLAYTARVGDLALARILLQNKADINVHDDLGYTPLHSTALAANAEMVKLLLENGADPNIKDKLGNTPLLVYGQLYEPQISELLLAHKADVNARNEEGLTSLSVAVEAPNGELVELLLKNGAEVNAADKYGRTALHHAVWSQSKDILELLIAHGADINAKDKGGNTPLDLTKHPFPQRNPSQHPIPVQPGVDVSEMADLLRKHGAKE